MKASVLSAAFKMFMLCLVVSNSAQARDDVGEYSIADAMSLEKAKEALGTDIKFYFGNQAHPKPQKNYGEFSTNKKTSAFGKSDKAACDWVFLSAMIALRDRALREGGNAVVNIKSNYKGNLTVSDDTYQCGAGAVMAGVALVGTVIKM